MNNVNNGDSLDHTVLQRIDPNGDESDRRNVITVRDIFNLLAEHGTTRKIIRKNPGIKRETIALGRAFMIAKHPHLYDEVARKKPLKEYRLLVDENIPARVIAAMHYGFGYATHTNFAGLAGKPDPDVWAWAVNNRIDAIVTRDRRRKNHEQDLTEIAVRSALSMMESEAGGGIDYSDLPLVVHVPDCDKIMETVAWLFKRFRDDIQRHMENRTSPFIRVTESGVFPGPTYAELKADLEARCGARMAEHKERYDQWVEEWMREILSQKPGGSITPEREAEIRRQVEESAALCVMSLSQPSPRARFTQNHAYPDRPPTAVPRDGAHLP